MSPDPRRLLLVLAVAVAAATSLPAAAAGGGGFGSDSSFKEQFTKTAGDEGSDGYSTLRRRIQPICRRTLRRQVLEYVPFTNRVSLTQDFTPTDQEWQLYELVSNYLQRPQAYALPAGQRNLITLVLRKYWRHHLLL